MLPSRLWLASDCYSAALDSCVTRRSRAAITGASTSPLGVLPRQFPDSSLANFGRESGMKSFKMSEQLDRQRDEQFQRPFWPLIVAGLGGSAAVGAVPFLANLFRNVAEDQGIGRVNDYLPELHPAARIAIFAVIALWCIALWSWLAVGVKRFDQRLEGRPNPPPTE